MWTTNCCSDDRLVSSGGSLTCPHSLMWKMWRRTELPNIKPKKCTCVWARKFCTLFCRLLMAGRSVKKLMSVSVFDRIVPNLVAVILFCTFILPWAGTGPLWNQVVKQKYDICKSTWWRNLLFIQNYFGSENLVSVIAAFLWLLLKTSVLFLDSKCLQCFF